MFPNRRHHRAGIALMLVVAVIALATVLGYAMLTSAALQTRAGSNHARLASAEYLAESGLNIAMYYLQYPEQATGYPNFGGLGYWSGTGGDVTLTAADNGTVNISVRRDTTNVWTYEVVSVGKAGKMNETRVTRTTGARIYVRNQFTTKHAGAFNANTSVFANISFQGNCWSYRNLGIRLGSPMPSVTGIGYTSTPVTGVGWLTPAGGWGVPVNTLAPAPGADLNLYKTYWYDDVKYNCKTVPSNPLAVFSLGPSADNPAGVWYIRPGGSLGFNVATYNINGTLVVEGDFRVVGPATTINITPQAGFPALIVTGNLEVAQPQNKVNINGICYVGGQIRTTGSVPASSALYSALNITGALLTGSTTSAPFTSPHIVPTVIKYDASKAKAPDLGSATQRSPKGISVLRWGLP